MDYRNVIQTAGSVLLLSIPAEFRKKHNIKKGDAMMCEIDNDRIIYTIIRKNEKAVGITDSPKINA